MTQWSPRRRLTSLVPSVLTTDGVHDGDGEGAGVCGASVLHHVLGGAGVVGRGCGVDGKDRAGVLGEGRELYTVQYLVGRDGSESKVVIESRVVIFNLIYYHAPSRISYFPPHLLPYIYEYHPLPDEKLTLFFAFFHKFLTT